MKSTFECRRTTSESIQQLIDFFVTVLSLFMQPHKHRQRQSRGKKRQNMYLHRPYISYLHLGHFLSNADLKFTKNNVGSTDRITK